MNNYLKQIWYELRHQPMVTITTVMGTAFAIFLMMAVFITSSLDTVPVAPETNRPRLMFGQNIHIKYEKGESSGGMSYNTARRLYGNLDGIERISFANSWAVNLDVSVKDGDCVSLFEKKVDDAFWEIFDFTFVSGRPFDKASVDARLKKAIITESAAVRLFGKADVAGKEIKINHVPHIVQGVVKDTSPLLVQSFANIYTVYAPEEQDNLWIDGYGGDTQVILLKAPGVSDEHIRNQVKSRYATFASVLKKEGKQVDYHQAPYTAETVNLEFGSNTDPDPDTPRKLRYAVYLILLILPAINLSSMTRSRLRRRVSEIGVRRAFGATKAGIMSRFLGENLILTLAGGIIGLVLCLVFVVFFSNLFISYGGKFGNNDIAASTPTINMLLNFKTFGIALLFCLLLNVISTGMPAWRASKVNPAEAISGKND